MKALLASLAILLVASTAVAADADADANETKWYVGIGGGQSGFRNVCSGAESMATLDSCDDEAVAWKVTLGRKLSKLWDIELSYIDAGEAKVTASSPAGTLVVNPRMVVGYAVLDMPVTKHFGLFVKAGLSYFNTTFERTGGFLAMPSGDDGVEGALGAGLSWRGWKHVGLRAEWEHFNDAASINSGDIDMATISLMFHF
jgi:opacity protein-like surface antigen